MSTMKSCFGKVALIALTFISGFLGATSAQSEAPTQLELIIPTPLAPVFLPLLVAQKMGWYADGGVTVTMKVITGDANATRALVAGEGDIAYLGAGTSMLARLNGADLKIIGSAQPIVDYRIVARPDAGDLAALGNKRWATAAAGGMTEVLPKMSMAKNGIDYSRAQFTSLGGQTTRYQAVVAGTVDAALVDTALAVKGRTEGHTRIVRSIIEDFPKMAYAYYVVRTSTLNDPLKRNALATFVRGSILGARYVADHPREAAQIMSDALNSRDLDQTSEVLQEMTKLGVWGLNGGTERDIYDFSERTLREIGELSSPVPYEEIVDSSLVDDNLKALGRR